MKSFIHLFVPIGLFILIVVMLVNVSRTTRNLPEASELVTYEDKANNVTCYRVKGLPGISCLKDQK